MWYVRAWQLREIVVFRGVRMVCVRCVRVCVRIKRAPHTFERLSSLLLSNEGACGAWRSDHGQTRKDWRQEWLGVGMRRPPEFAYRPTKSGAVSSFRYKGHSVMMWRRQGQTITTGWNRKPLGSGPSTGLPPHMY